MIHQFSEKQKLVYGSIVNWLNYLEKNKFSRFIPIDTEEAFHQIQMNSFKISKVENLNCISLLQAWCEKLIFNKALANNINSRDIYVPFENEPQEETDKYIKELDYLQRRTRREINKHIEIIFRHLNSLKVDFEISENPKNKLPSFELTTKARKKGLTELLNDLKSKKYVLDEVKLATWRKLFKNEVFDGFIDWKNNETSLCAFVTTLKSNDLIKNEFHFSVAATYFTINGKNVTNKDLSNCRPTEEALLLFTKLVSSINSNK